MRLIDHTPQKPRVCDFMNPMSLMDTIKELLATASELKYLSTVVQESKDLSLHLLINEKIKESTKRVVEGSLGLASDLFKYRFNASIDLSPDSFEYGTTVIEATDKLLEVADTSLESLKRKPSATLNEQAIVAHITINHKGKQNEFKVVHAQNIPRPQTNFAVENSNQEFVVERSEAQKRLVEILGDQVESNILSIYPETITRQEQHPILPLDQTPLFFVSNEADLIEAVRRISHEPEIAIDIENHNYRSFQGFSCLLQISTRKEDFLFDTIALRHLVHSAMKDLFSNNAVKVFHGAESDILWLQRDFNIHVHNLFDTFYAAGALGSPSRSLASLVKDHTGVSLTKEYQLADWRIRPLTKEMINYARNDTHYLLSVYDTLKNQLIEKKLLPRVLVQSFQLTFRQYKRPVCSPNGYKTLRHDRPLNKKQQKILKAVFEWRDAVAREEDESLHYVMPKMMMLRIAETVPKNSNEILRCYNPVPPIVRQRVTDILLLIKKTLKEKTEEEERDQTVGAKVDVMDEELNDEPLFEFNATDNVEPLIKCSATDNVESVSLRPNADSSDEEESIYVMKSTRISEPVQTKRSFFESEDELEEKGVEFTSLIGEIKEPAKIDQSSSEDESVPEQIISPSSDIFVLGSVPVQPVKPEPKQQKPKEKNKPSPIVDFVQPKSGSRKSK